MNDLTIETVSGESAIHCGAGSFEKYAPLLKGRQLFVVTDSNVFALYRYLLWETFGGEFEIVILPAGEKSKNAKNLLSILKNMLEKGMRRNCCVVAFGGGVVGDIAGLAASLYMRGTHLVQIPTTLLSQVDSSVGGKTAVDMGGVKNVVGTFYQPEEVIIDPRFLSTLPEREIRCGLGEIVKYGALDAGIYSKLCLNINGLTDKKFLEEIVFDCVKHKAAVVGKDEHDINGVRKTLNLGHTTGHAFELYYGRKSHGEYVLAGMAYELYIARKYGICGGQYADNIEKIVRTAIKKIPVCKNISEAAGHAVYDKKNDDEKITLIVPAAEGQSAEIKLDKDEYVKLLMEAAVYYGEM